MSNGLKESITKLKRGYEKTNFKELQKDETEWTPIKLRKITIPPIVNIPKDEGYGYILQFVHKLEDIVYPIIFKNLLSNSSLVKNFLKIFIKMVYGYNIITISELENPSQEKLINIDYIT